MKAAFLIFFIFFTISLASAQTVSIGDYSIDVDSEVTIPITISDAELIAGGVVNISFDPSIVSVRGVTAGDFGNPVPNINNINGWVKIVAADINAVNKSQAVFANLISKGFSPGQTRMNITYASLNNEFGQLIKPGVVNGSITVKQISVYHPYVHLKSLSSLKTVDNVKASYSIGIFNGQNIEDTFDLTVLNHNLSSVAALNQSIILIPPWESREFTLNVTDETPGEYYVSVRATSKSNLSVKDEIMTKTVVLESFMINLTSYEGSRTSIGANITYYLTIQNNQKIKDTLTLSRSGIDLSWISFDTIQELGAGEQKTIPVTISIPDTAGVGSFTLTISALSYNLGTSRGASLPLIVQSGPVISSLAPIDNSRLGSGDVVFSWITNINSTTRVILNQSGNETFFIGNEGIYHTIIVENLTRNQWYTYKVISNTSHGSTESEERTIYIDNGVTFTKRIYDFNIERDYDQRFNITVKNTDVIAHEILLTVNSTNPDLIVGFVGEGSIDEMITLAPGETRDVTLALHAQDAMQKDYYLLLDLNTNESISDHAVANVHVRQPNIDLRLEEISIDPLTLTKTFRLRNYGDTVTDLNIYESGGLKGNVTFQPIITHGYMGNGGSVAFEVAPVLSLDFTGMEGDIVVEAAGVKKSFPVNFTLPDGKKIYLGVMPNITIKFSNLFDNDSLTFTNPSQNQLVDTFTLNETPTFVAYFLVDVYDEIGPLSDANVSLNVWSNNSHWTIFAKTDSIGKILFTIQDNIDEGDYFYRADIVGFKVHTETRKFSPNNTPSLKIVNNIYWSNVSDSSSTFNLTENNQNEVIELNGYPFIFRANKNKINANESIILKLTTNHSTIYIKGGFNGNEIVFNSSLIPSGNYSSTIISTYQKGIEISSTKNISIYNNYEFKNISQSHIAAIPLNSTHYIEIDSIETVIEPSSNKEINIEQVTLENEGVLINYSIKTNKSKTDIITLVASDKNGEIINITKSVNLINGTSYFEENIPVKSNEFNITIYGSTIVKQFRISSSGGVAGSTGLNVLTDSSSCVLPNINDLSLVYIIPGISRYDSILCDTSIYKYDGVGAGSPDISISFLMGATDASFDDAEGWSMGGSVSTGGIFSGLGGKIAMSQSMLPSSNVHHTVAGGITFGSPVPSIKGEVGYSRKITTWKPREFIEGLINSKFNMNNWYCTNRPIIYSYFLLPHTIKPSMSPTSNIDDGYLVMRFIPSYMSPRPHDVYVYLNNVEIGKLTNTIPSGYYILRFDPILLNYADQGVASNTISLRTRHLNGGHYAITTDMKIILPMNGAEMYVVANNQSEANQIVEDMTGTMRNKPDFAILPENIQFLNNNYITGENLSINTTLFNLGTVGASRLKLQILDNGAQIGENVTVGFIPSMSSIPANITWNPTPGPHSITVRINPDRRIQEADYTNNEASRSINVGNAQDKIPPHSITNPILQAAGPTWLNFTWTNPHDPDFSKVMLYLNSTFKTIILAPQNYYNFTGLLPNTSYELGTHTVDTSGNVNQTWVNKTARTAPIDKTPVVIFPGMTNPPTDPDGDGLYEDINGNVRKDFNDVVLFFNYLEWVAGNQPISSFDFNGNGRIDFNDIIKLFEEL